MTSFFNRLGAVTQRFSAAWQILNSDNPSGAMKILEELYARQQSHSGVVVNWKTALEAATSFACARVIGGDLAQVPFKLMQDDGEKRNPKRDDPLYEVLYLSPNDWMTSFEFRMMMVFHLVFCGNFFAYKNRYQGEVAELLPYEPQQVTVIRDGWDLEYEVQTDEGKPIRIPKENMWHVRGPSWNGWMGLEGVKLARHALGLGMAAEKHGSLLFKNGAHGVGYLTTPNKVSDTEAKDLRESWNERVGGDNVWGTPVLWNGLEWKSMTAPNDETQFIETRKFQVEETCRFFNVLPIMVGYSDKTATYASAEQMFIAHVVHTMSPWGVAIEQSADKNLITPQKRRAGYYTKFNFNALLRGSAKDRSDYYKAALGAGGSYPWMTQDEVRELEDMNPMGGTAKELRDPYSSSTDGNKEETTEPSIVPAAQPFMKE